MKKRIFNLIIIILLCLSFSYILLNIINKNNSNKLINKEVIKPYGEEITINDFLKEDLKDVKSNIDLNSLKEVGTYEIIIKIILLI